MEEEEIVVEGETEFSSNKSSKRFSDEQVKLLESMFKEKTKLEPRKKLELARNLGLQPRQVAIWFQNRRARWKSKQMEQEYKLLKAEFDSLNMKFELLKKEKESLLKQLKELNDQLENNHNGSTRSQDSINSESSDNGGTELELKDKIPGCSMEQFKWKEEAESEFWKMEELGDSSIVSSDNWNAVALNDTFDLSCGNSKWWEF